MDFPDFTPDPDNPGNVMVWAVVRDSPWKVYSAYRTEDEAKADLVNAGEGFRVAFGSLMPGTDNFVSS